MALDSVVSDMFGKSATAITDYLTSDENFDAQHCVSLMMTISRAEYEHMQAQIDWLMEQLRLSRQKKFGASSEKASEELDEQMTLLFDEAEGYAYAAEQKAEKAKEETTSVASYERKKNSGAVRDVVPKDIPTQVVEHRLTQKELVCPECSGEMRQRGQGDAGLSAGEGLPPPGCLLYLRLPNL